MTFKPFSEFTITESFDTPAEFYMTDDTVMPRAIYAAANINGTDYGFSFVESTYARVYILEVYRVVTAKRRFWSFKDTKDVRPVLATLLKFVEACYPFLKNKFDGVIIDVPGKTGSELYTKFIERVIRKTYINTFRAVPVSKKTDKANNYLFITKRNVAPSSIFKTAAFHKHFDFDPNEKSADELYTSDNIDVMNQPKKPERQTVSLKPSRRFSFTRLEISGDNIDQEYLESLDDIKNRIQANPAMIKKQEVDVKGEFASKMANQQSLEDFEELIASAAAFVEPEDTEVKPNPIPVMYTIENTSLEDIEKTKFISMPMLVALNAVLSDDQDTLIELEKSFTLVDAWFEMSSDWRKKQTNEYITMYLMPLADFKHPLTKYDYGAGDKEMDSGSKGMLITSPFMSTYRLLSGLKDQGELKEHFGALPMIKEMSYHIGGAGGTTIVWLEDISMTKEKAARLKNTIDKTRAYVNAFKSVSDEEKLKAKNTVKEALFQWYQRELEVKQESGYYDSKVEIQSLEGVAMPMATQEEFAKGNEHKIDVFGDYFLTQNQATRDNDIKNLLITSDEIAPFYKGFEEAFMNAGAKYKYDRTPQDFLSEMYGYTEYNDADGTEKRRGKEWYEERGWTEEDILGAQMLLQYTGNYYRRINGLLRQTLWDKQPSIKPYDVDQFESSKALYENTMIMLKFFQRKATPTPYDMWVYRNSKVRDIDSLSVGDDYTDAGFWSVSTQMTIGINSSSGIRSKIFLPKGTRIMPVIDNSTNSGEGELLLAPMSIVKVLKLIKAETSSGYNNVKRGLIGIYTGNAMDSFMEASENNMITDYLKENKEVTDKKKETEEDTKWNQTDISVADMKKITNAIAKGKLTKKL